MTTASAATTSRRRPPTAPCPNMGFYFIINNEYDNHTMTATNIQSGHKRWARASDSRFFFWGGLTFIWFRIREQNGNDENDGAITTATTDTRNGVEIRTLPINHLATLLFGSSRFASLSSSLCVSNTVVLGIIWFLLINICAMKLQVASRPGYHCILYNLLQGPQNYIVGCSCWLNTCSCNLGNSCSPYKIGILVVLCDVEVACICKYLAARISKFTSTYYRIWLCIWIYVN